jgi:hypothetical protein
MKTYETLFIHFCLKDTETNIKNAIQEGIEKFKTKYTSEIPEKILKYVNDLTLTYSEKTIEFAKNEDFKYPFDHQAFITTFEIELFHKFKVELYLDGLN